MELAYLYAKAKSESYFFLLLNKNERAYYQLIAHASVTNLPW